MHHGFFSQAMVMCTCIADEVDISTFTVAVPGPLTEHHCEATISEADQTHGLKYGKPTSVIGAVTPSRSGQRFLAFEETLVVAFSRWNNARSALCERK